MINNVVLVSGVQQSDSVIRIHVSILFQILFPFRLLQNIEQHSLCYTVGPLLVIYFILFYYYFFRSHGSYAQEDYFFYFIYLFLAALRLRCCSRAFSSCGKWGLLFVSVHRLLIAVASLCCRARTLGVWTSVVVARGLSSCGARA